MPSLDPTKTSTLRLRYAKAMNRRFLALSRDVRASFITQGALHINEAARPGEFDHPTDEGRLHAFEDWLRIQMLAIILEVSSLDNIRRRIARHWQNRFLRAAYIRGVTSAETELRRLGRLAFPVDEVDIAVETGTHAETLGLMYARAYEALRGITESLNSQMSQVFSQSLIEGVSIATIVDRLTLEIAKARNVRAESLARTEVIRTYNEAKLNIFEQNGITVVSTDLEFTTARDSRVCPICAALDGKRFTIAEARGVIPVHPRCLPGDAIVTASPRISAVFKRWYDGDMIVIHTAGGNDLTCTPNHPVLTNQGFVAAKLLNTGDKVVCCGVGDREAVISIDGYYMPTSIEDIAESFFRSSQVMTMEMPMSPEYFYSDGVGSDVYVVGADINLLNDINPPGIEHFHNHGFMRGYIGLTSESPLSHIALMIESQRLTSGSVMSSLDLVGSPSCGHLTPFDSLGLALSSRRDSILNKSFSDDGSGDFEFTSDLFLGYPGIVQRDNSVYRDVIIPRLHGVDARLFQDTDNIPIRDSGIDGDLFRSDMGDVSVDDVTSVDVVGFSGHVYDLQTEYGFFIANSIAVSNCRCSWKAITEEEEDAA